MSGMSSGSLVPTWIGHVNTTRDALILFEACLQGQLNHVPRRPHDRERSQLIRSGYVFIFEENASGIKRWTDGVPWSPSRILGNFLVYRELMKPFPPGEKKRATKRSKALSKTTRSGEPYPRQQSTDSLPPSPTMGKLEGGADSNEERALIGSLIDSYGFKEGGLVKKTISVNLHGIQHHLVSYYKVEDVKKGNLQSPSTDTDLLGIEPRMEFIAQQSFKSPLDALEDTLQDQMNALHNDYAFDYRPAAPTASTSYTSNPSSMDVGMYTTSGYQPYSYYPTTSKQGSYDNYGLQYTSSNSTAATTPYTYTSSPAQLGGNSYRQLPTSAQRIAPPLRPPALTTDRKDLSGTNWPSGGNVSPYTPSPSPYTPSPSPSTSIRSSYPSYSNTSYVRNYPTTNPPKASNPTYSRLLETNRNSYPSSR